MQNVLLRRAFLAVCISTLASLPTSAQTFTGGLRGSVNDAGGILPGVSVTIINEGTQVSRETTTNASGEYSFSAVPPATYTIRAGLTGFNNAAEWPNLTRALIERGYSDDAVGKILGGNFLRLFRAVAH